MLKRTLIIFVAELLIIAAIIIVKVPTVNNFVRDIFTKNQVSDTLYTTDTTDTTDGVETKTAKVPVYENVEAFIHAFFDNQYSAMNIAPENASVFDVNQFIKTEMPEEIEVTISRNEGSLEKVILDKETMERLIAAAEYWFLGGNDVKVFKNIVAKGTVDRP